MIKTWRPKSLFTYFFKGSKQNLFLDQYSMYVKTSFNIFFQQCSVKMCVFLFHFIKKNSVTFPNYFHYFPDNTSFRFKSTQPAFLLVVSKWTELKSLSTYHKCAVTLLRYFFFLPYDHKYAKKKYSVSFHDSKNSLSKNDFLSLRYLHSVFILSLLKPLKN